MNNNLVAYMLKWYNAIKNRLLKERGVLKKLSCKQKKWYISRSKKADFHLRKFNKRKKKRNPQKSNRHSTLSRKEKAQRKNHILVVPKVFSLTKNSDETLAFFKKVFDTINRCKQYDWLMFDMEETEEITPDALMYLLALIKNLTKLTINKINCRGNLPQKQPARDYIQNSGFLGYMEYNGKKPEITNSEKRIQITCGETSDGKTAGIACEFVHTQCGITILNTKSLYPMLLELMANTNQHAYQYDVKMKRQWFIYAEALEDRVNFVFLDTGKGIPSTVKKNFAEIVSRIVNANDAKFIKSALKGGFRTETGELHRGKGLPEIYNYCKNNKISDLTIFSNRGKCVVNDSCEIKMEEIENFEGTLFSWSIKKEGNL